MFLNVLGVRGGSPVFGVEPYVADLVGRGGAIRTPDPLRPRQVRYQAALRPDKR